LWPRDKSRIVARADIAVASRFFGQELFCLVETICVIVVSDAGLRLFAARRLIYSKANFRRHFNAPLTKFADGII
jgi:hypothetical protein